MNDYETLRKEYRPNNIKVLLIAESPPPTVDIKSSRHFYRTGNIYPNDRLFTNTIRALYPETAELPELELKEAKQQWLRRFAADGYYMIEALETSQKHEVTKAQRQDRIARALPRLIARVKQLANEPTGVVLIKSNVFDVAAKPLREAGFNVLNTELIDYPGRFNQKAYRQKLATLITAFRSQNSTDKSSV